MKYVNKKTGVIFTTTSEIKGGDWVPFNEEPKEPVEETSTEEVTTEEVVEEPGTEVFDLTTMTVEQLKEYAKENEITVPSKANKDEIIRLISEAFNG